MDNVIKEKLKVCGKGVVVYPLAKIVKPEVVEVGDCSKIDDFVFIYGGRGIRIGRYVHIASFVSIIGGGELIVEDYAAIAAGSRIITGTDRYEGGKRMSGALPLEQRNVLLGKVILKKDVFLGTNVVVHPNVTIGEGAIIGSNSLVTEDVEPWTINVGSPCRVIGKRPKVKVKDI
jgi:galactoside O-acetyltransferase